MIAVNMQLITNPRQLALRRGTQDLGGGNLRSLGKESCVEVMRKEGKREGDGLPLKMSGRTPIPKHPRKGGAESDNQQRVSKI